MYCKKTCIHLLTIAWALIFVSMAFGFNPNTDESLMGWWKMDEGSGTTAADSSGNGKDAVLTGGPLWVEGYFKSGIEFDGTDDYLLAPPVNLNSDRATFTAWVWCNGAQTEYAAIMMCRGGGTISCLNFKPGNTMGYHWNDGSATWSFVGPVVPQNEWAFEAMVIDPTQSKFYMNGIDNKATQANANATQAFSSDFNIGRDPQGGRQFSGRLDDCRVYKRDLTEPEILMVMRGGVNPGLTSEPTPKDIATDVPRDTTFEWIPGQYPGTHDVYIGTSFEDVNTALRTSPLLVSKGQAAATYTPAKMLDFGQMYYWRVDEVNSTDAFIHKGLTWSFTAETYGYEVEYPVHLVKATASSFSNALTGPEKTIDGSGLNALDQHSMSASHMWLSKSKQTPVWIKYEFDQVYSLHQMWVWNQNQLTELDNGYGAMDVTVETSTDGEAWTALADVPQFAQASGEDTYVHNTTVDFGGVLAKFVRLNIASNWGDARSSGLSEVRFFYVPVKAFGPTPAVGAAGVAVDGTLNWRPGRKAAGHEVYLGTDPNALAQVGTATGHTYSLVSAGAEYDRTYHWKINEVNAADVWAGDTWSFSTAGYFVVDNFESYDDKCKRIFYTWADGYGATTAPECGGVIIAGNGTGAAVGNPSAPYAEKTVVHGGSQSMPLFYDNPGATSVSEAVRTFAVPQDWVQGGIKTLVLYFHGDVDNAAGQLYAKINNAKVVYTGNAQALTQPLWKQWNIDLASVGGNLRSVGSLTIGVSGSGKGLVLIDDIRLYRSAPAVVAPVDPGTAGLSAYYTMEGDVKDSSGKGNNGTLVNDPVFVDSTKAGLGKALLFDGVNDHVELPIGTLISTLTSATFATWVNFDSSNANNWQRIFDFGTSSSNYLFLCPRGGTTTGTMRFAIRQTTSEGESGLNAPAMLPGGWHHVAVVIDGAAKTMQLCFDGQVVASGATLVLPKDLGVTNQNWLGRSQYTADGYLTGQLDEFRIYNRALSAGEVQYLAGDR